MLTPRRRRSHEYIDDPAIDPGLLRRSMQDVRRANALFGGANVALAEMRKLFRRSRGESLLLIDVGTGLGDIPHHARRCAERYGVALGTVGVERSGTLALAARSSRLPMVHADARQLPFRDRAADIVLCSQLLHHFEAEAAMTVIRELSRIARRLVIVADLRRSWVGAGLFRISSLLLRFHPVTRHDGTVSVLRGFTPEELADLVSAATGIRPRVRRHPGFRLSAAWAPSP